MDLKELKEKLKDCKDGIKSSFKYKATYYRPLFKFTLAPATAGLMWLVASFLMLGEIMSDPDIVFNVSKELMVNSFFVATLIVTGIIAFTRLLYWDKVNGLMYLAETIVTYLGFLIARKFDSFMMVGIIGFALSLVFAYLIDKEGRRLIDRAKR